MLRKLIKHEFRATSRIMWPIFLGMLALSVVMRVLMPVIDRAEDSYWLLNLIGVLISVGFAFGLMALCLAPLVLSAVRWREHVLKNEGYLTLTLPVSMHQLLLSKLIVSAVWYAAAFLAVLLLAMGAVVDFSFWRELPGVLSDVMGYIGRLDGETRGQVVLFGLELLGNCVFAVSAVSLMIYAAYAVGYSFNRHKSGATALLIIAFSQITQIAGLYVLVESSGESGVTTWTGLTAFQAVNWLMLIGILGELATCAVYYLITWYFTTKKLNLE